MDYADSDFRQIIEAVWTSILGLETPFQTGPVQEGDDKDLIGCCVHISGAWDGLIVLECSESLLRHAAAVMFGTAPDTVDSVSMKDALGEITNMIGGNIKSLLPEPCYVSLPSPTQGVAPIMARPGHKLVGHVAFKTSGHTFRVATIRNYSVTTEPDAAHPGGEPVFPSKPKEYGRQAIDSSSGGKLPTPIMGIPAGTHTAPRATPGRRHNHPLRNSVSAVRPDARFGRFRDLCWLGLGETATRRNRKRFRQVICFHLSGLGLSPAGLRQRSPTRFDLPPKQWTGYEARAPVLSKSSGFRSPGLARRR